MRSFLLIILSFAFAVTAIAADQKKATSDDVIFDTVRRKLANDPDVKGGALDVDVKDGAVTVKGRVKTDKARSKAERIIHKVKGVTNVTNQIVVDPT